MFRAQAARLHEDAPDCGRGEHKPEGYRPFPQVVETSVHAGRLEARHERRECGAIRLGLVDDLDQAGPVGVGCLEPRWRDYRSVLPVGFGGGGGACGFGFSGCASPCDSFSSRSTYSLSSFADLTFDPGIVLLEPPPEDVLEVKLVSTVGLRVEDQYRLRRQDRQVEAEGTPESLGVTRQWAHRELHCQGLDMELPAAAVHQVHDAAQDLRARHGPAGVRHDHEPEERVRVAHSGLRDRRAEGQVGPLAVERAGALQAEVRGAAVLLVGKPDRDPVTAEVHPHLANSATRGLAREGMVDGDRRHIAALEQVLVGRPPLHEGGPVARLDGRAVVGEALAEMRGHVDRPQTRIHIGRSDDSSLVVSPEGCVAVDVRQVARV